MGTINGASTGAITGASTGAITGASTGAITGASTGAITGALPEGDAEGTLATSTDASEPISTAFEGGCRPG